MTIVAMLQLMSAHGAQVLRVLSDYDKNYALLVAVSKHDRFWKSVFTQSVYVKLDKTRFRKIIDEELLKGAKAKSKQPQPTADENTERPPESVVEPIRPEIFLNNVMSSNRNKIGTVVDMAIDVLKAAITCLAYKDTMHLMTLIRVEITRKLDHKKSVKRSKMAKSAVAAILMKMGAMQFTDELLLDTMSFLEVFESSKTAVTVEKFDFTPFLDKVVGGMMDYVKERCARPANTLMEIAKELGVMWNEDLYDPSMSKSIPDQDFKAMFVSSISTIEQHYGKLGLDFGMGANTWNDILHFQKNVGQQKGFLKIDSYQS